MTNKIMIVAYMLLGLTLLWGSISAYAQVQVQQSQSSTVNGHTHNQSFHCFGLVGCTSNPSSKEFKAGYHKLFDDWNALCPNGKNSTDFCAGFLQASNDLSNK